MAKLQFLSHCRSLWSSRLSMNTINFICHGTILFVLQSVIPLWKQLLFYKGYQMKLRAHLGEIQAKQIINEGIHMISIGTNDFLENYYAFPGGRRSTQYTISEYENFLAGIAENFVRELYGLGARKISLGGVPPMGCMPLERNTNLMGGRECVQSYNTVALEFNDKLSKLVTRLNKELPGINLVFSNPYFIFMQIIRRPSLYGKLLLLFMPFSNFLQSCMHAFILFPFQI